MERKPVSNPDLAALGEFQGTIERNSNFRKQAFDHNLGRNVRVAKLLAYLAMIRQTGVSLTGSVECTAAVKQNFSSSKAMTHMGMPTGPTQAAHFLPGQVRIGGKEIWQFATNPATRGHIEFLFAEVEHLPVVFNQADTAAEGKGRTDGLCSALVSACTTLIRQTTASRRKTRAQPAGRSNGAFWQHPRSTAGMAFNWSSVGLPHPDSPAGMIFDWASIGLPHPDSPLGQRLNYNSLRPKAIKKSTRSGGLGLPPFAKKIPADAVQTAFDTWHREAMAAFRNALATKSAKPGIPPLVGDRFEGYTMESISARSTASSTLWNRDDSLRIIAYYLEDQEHRTGSWVTANCKWALREVESNYKG